MKKNIVSNAKDTLNKLTTPISSNNPITNYTNKTNFQKIYDFKEISKDSLNIINSIDPIQNIKKFTSTIKNPNEAMSIRLLELNKYKLSLFLNRELQQEILVGGDLTSNKINNEIVSQKYTFTEDKTNNLFLHKRVEDYFVLIHFRYLKPNKDRKKIAEFKNNSIKEQNKKFGITTGIFHTLVGAEQNPDYLDADRDDLISEGVKEDDEQVTDMTPFFFNINLINKKSECLQYISYSENTKISVDKIKFYNPEQTSNFVFLSDFNLKKSQDDWDLAREQTKLNYGQIDKREVIERTYSDLHPNEVYGPIFYTLNKSLQEELIRLLYKLEVTSEINNFVKYLGLNRERREYVGWLFKIIKYLNI